MQYSPLIWMVVSLLGWACQPAAPERAFPLGEMEEGDLAFRCGYGVFSRAVTAAEEEGVYSHVGIIVRENGRWRVIHAVPGEKESKEDFDRVKIEDLELFYSGKRALKGCLVHTGLRDSALVSSLCHQATQAARDSVRFDHNYLLEDSTEVYCTEFVWRLYRQCQIDLSEGRRRSVHAFHIHGDVLLPEHLLAYSGNDVYFSY